MMAICRDRLVIRMVACLVFGVTVAKIDCRNPLMSTENKGGRWASGKPKGNWKFWCYLYYH